MAGRSTSVMVSPIFVSATSFILAIRNPTSPARSSSISTGFGFLGQRFYVEDATLPHQTEVLSRFAEGSLENAHEHDHSAKGVKPGIKDQRLQARFGIAIWRRNSSTTASKTSERLGLISRWSESPPLHPGRGDFNHVSGPGDSSAGQIDLVDHGNNLEAVSLAS